MPFASSGPIYWWAVGTELNQLHESPIGASLRWRHELFSASLRQCPSTSGFRGRSRFTVPTLLRISSVRSKRVSVFAQRPRASHSLPRGSEEHPGAFGQVPPFQNEPPVPECDMERLGALVPPSERWPGLTLTPELEEGVRQTFEFESKTLRTVEVLSIVVAPLPGLGSVTSKQDHAWHRNVGRRARAQAHQERDGIPYLGTERVLARHPSQRPICRKHSTRVRCFSSNSETRREYMRRYSEFVDGLRQSYGDLLEAWRRIGGREFCLPGFGLTANYA